MKQGMDGAKNIMFDEEAQRQVRAFVEAAKVGKPDPHVETDPARAEARERETRERAFTTRREEVEASASSDASRLASFARKAEQLESYGGYLAHLNSLTMMGERKPTPEEWIQMRDSYRDYADDARESHYASSHATAMLEWAKDKPDALALATETTKGQLNEARQALDAAAIEVSRLWTQSPSSPDFAQAQAALVERQKVVQRFERSLRLIEKGV